MVAAAHQFPIASIGAPRVAGEHVGHCCPVEQLLQVHDGHAPVAGTSVVDKLVVDKLVSDTFVIDTLVIDMAGPSNRRLESSAVWVTNDAGAQRAERTIRPGFGGCRRPTMDNNSEPGLCLVEGGCAGCPVVMNLAITDSRSAGWLHAVRGSGLNRVAATSSVSATVARRTVANPAI